MKDLQINNKSFSCAQWVRVDLHLHSPHVESFKLPQGINIDSKKDREKITKDYINKLKETNIKVAAITDYNGIRKEWFDLLKSEAEKNEILILPGVELYISASGGGSGLHLILVLDNDNDIDIEGFNRFLHSLDKNPQKPLVEGRKHRDIEATHELESLIEEIRKRYNCLIIFAHPEDDKGIFKTYRPKDAARYFSKIRPDALEFYSDDWEQRLLSTNEVDKELLSRIPRLENSDPKEIDEIGFKVRNNKVRATYIKLSELSLSALKIAILDPKLRVKLYERPEMYHNRINKISINGSTFLKDIELSFNPELNTFIGGRGVGKSAILETIRYCMELPYYIEDKIQKINFISEVVGSGGEINIFIDKFYGEQKTSYKVKRILGKEPEVYDERGHKLNLRPIDIFESERAPILIGQKELYFISQNERFLLEIIDQIIGEKIKEKQKEFDKHIFELKENANKILEIHKKILKKEEYEQEFKIIESKIKDYERLGVLEKLKTYTEILNRK